MVFWGFGGRLVWRKDGLGEKGGKKLENISGGRFDGDEKRRECKLGRGGVSWWGEVNVRVR